MTGAAQPPSTLIVALPGSEPLARALARRLRCEATPLALHRFPDGEARVRLDVPPDGRDVVLVAHLNPPDAVTLPLLFAADAARELGARQVGLVAPYLAYMRQDTRFQPGEAVTSRSYARLLSSSLDFLVTVDPHLHRWHSLDQIYTLRSRVVAAAPWIARWLRRHVRQPLLVGPDAESRQWVAEVARLTGAPFTVMAKTRRGDRDVSVALEDPGPWPGCTPVLLDDMASTGHTLIAAAQLLAGSGLPPPECVVVHALLDDAALQKLHEAGIARLVSCDTLPHATNAVRLAAPLAQALREMLSPPG